MKYKVGEIVEGKVTGIQPYGAFVFLDEETSGLIHISEIADGYIKDIHKYVRVDDTIKVKIIDYDKETHQARLSLKALKNKRAQFRKRTELSDATLPPMMKGFSTINEHMDQWIKNAEEEMKHDEI
ncbi:MAG: S1 RNA-binding domain-containing protein [Solobacterium sp.]|nr:S1 RNA-binding domain-containing protein [Solobacterium sp.]